MFKKLFILLVSSLITAPVLGTQGTHEQALLMLQQLNAEIRKKVRDQEIVRPNGPLIRIMPGGAALAESVMAGQRRTVPQDFLSPVTHNQNIEKL